MCGWGLDSMVKVVAVIQARLSSSRLPAKVMLDLAGKTVLERVVDRVKLASVVDEIVVATSTHDEDDVIEALAKRMEISCYRGSLENVMSRFHNVAHLTNADIIIRITADNPFTEPAFIEQLVNAVLNDEFDYAAMNNIPIGSGVEVFTAESFNRIASQVHLTAHNLEHVTSFYYQNSTLFKLHYVDSDYGQEVVQIRLTLDTFDDYVQLFRVYSNLMKDNVPPTHFLEEAISLYSTKFI